MSLESVCLLSIYLCQVRYNYFTVAFVKEKINSLKKYTTSSHLENKKEMIIDLDAK